MRVEGSDELIGELNDIIGGMNLMPGGEDPDDDDEEADA